MISRLKTKTIIFIILCVAILASGIVLLITTHKPQEEQEKNAAETSVSHVTVNNHSLSLMINGETVKALYTGEMTAGKPDGNGTVNAQTDRNTLYTYTGSWKDGKYSGYGILTVQPGYTYSGYWKNGLYDGEGSLIYDDPDYYRFIGHFEEGKYRPTLVQLIAALSSSSGNAALLSEKTARCLEQHEEAFLQHKTDSFSLADSFSYQDYSNAPDSWGDQLFREKLHITQVYRYEEEVFGTPVIMFIGYNAKREIYTGYYLGSLTDLQAENEVSITAFPIGSSSMKNADGDYLVTVRFVAVELKSPEN